MAGTPEKPEALPDAIREASLNPPGVTRAACDPEEQAAHDLVREEDRRLGLESETDPAGNLFLICPEGARDQPAPMIGSHLDSVPHGGNFDETMQTSDLLQAVRMLATAIEDRLI